MPRPIEMQGNEATSGTFAGGGRTPRLMTLPAMFLLLAAAGCNWTTFADDAAHAPVRSIAAPDAFKAQDFGRSLLPLSTGMGKAAAFVASSVNDTNIAVITVDTGGGVASTSVPGTSLNDTESSVISSLAEDNTSAPPKLLLGSPKVHNQGYGRFYTYPLSPMLDGVVATQTVPTFDVAEVGLGRGITVGSLAGVEAKADYVVASDSRLAVLVDGATATPTDVTGAAGCDTSFDSNQDARYLLRRPLLAARLWDDPVGTTVQQLVSATTHAAITPGKLSFLSVTGASPSFALNCLAAVSAPGPEMRPRFGTALASGDFNGDGAADLLVGAPGQHAYVYFGPFPSGGVPTPITIMDPDGVDFGYAVAALNIDGKPGDEALIGDPQATVGGQARAGRVTAYAWNGTSMVAKQTYSDHSPEADAKFGSTVNVLKFCTAATSPAAGTACAAAETAQLLLVGANNEVFLYYGVGSNIPLRSRGGQMVPDVRAP